MYPLKDLQLIGKMKLPPDVERTKLEVCTDAVCIVCVDKNLICFLQQHLSDEEFFQVFKQTKETFYKMAKWKQKNLKKGAYLF